MPASFRSRFMSLCWLCLLPAAAFAAEGDAPAPAAPAPVIAITAGDAAALQQALTAAVAGAVTKVVIPPGTYRFPATTSGTPHLQLVGATDLVVEGAGATLVFAGRDQPGFALRDCRRTTVRGLRLERDTPPCSQGRIERIEEDGRYSVVRIDPGYPQDVDDRRYFTTFWCNLFTADRTRWVAHYRGVTPTEIQRLAPDLVRVRMHTRPADLPVPLVPGLPVAWRGVVVDDLAVRNCEDCEVADVTVAGGAGMCFHERGGGGNRYRGCAVVVAAPPAGATEVPLLASSADGFHSSGARRGPLVEKCSFAALDDDAIAIHGTYALVMEAQGNQVLVWRHRVEENRLYGAAGDTLRFYDLRAVRSGEALITAVRKREGWRPAATPGPAFAAFGDPAVGEFVDITCDRPLPEGIAAGWLASNPACAGSGYVIRGCTIRDSYARGILAKGDHGLIEDNLISGLARSAIEFNPEMGHWSENDYGIDVTVRNNDIRDVARNRQPGELRHPGALTIIGYRNGAYVPAPGGHRDIVISGNRFSGIDGPNLLITAAQGVRVTGNRFSNAMRGASEFGRDKGVDPGALVWCAESRDVELRGNVVEDAGPAMQRLIGAGPGWTPPADVEAAFTSTP